MDFLVANPRLKKRKWTAEDLAERVETKKQAIARIKNLHQMVNKIQYEISTEEIRIQKHLKEIRLLEEEWLQPESNK
jgi:hypothetical protein